MVTSSIKCFLFESSLTTHIIFVWCIQTIEHLSQRHPNFLPSAISQYLFFINQIRTVYRKSGKTVAKVPSLIVINNFEINLFCRKSEKTDKPVILVVLYPSPTIPDNLEINVYGFFNGNVSLSGSHQEYRGTSSFHVSLVEVALGALVWW